MYSEHSRPVFTAQQLYDEILVPTVKTKNQRKAMKKPNPWFQDVWIWDGRPEWDEIFSDIKSREHRDIGVCFCGMALSGPVESHVPQYQHRRGMRVFVAQRLLVNHQTRVRGARASRIYRVRGLERVGAWGISGPWAG